MRPCCWAAGARRTILRRRAASAPWFLGLRLALGGHRTDQYKAPVCAHTLPLLRPRDPPCYPLFNLNFKCNGIGSISFLPPPHPPHPFSPHHANSWQVAYSKIQSSHTCASWHAFFCHSAAAPPTAVGRRRAPNAGAPVSLLSLTFYFFRSLTTFGFPAYAAAQPPPLFRASLPPCSPVLESLAGPAARPPSQHAMGKGQGAGLRARGCLPRIPPSLVLLFSYHHAPHLKPFRAAESPLYFHFFITVREKAYWPFLRVAPTGHSASPAQTVAWAAPPVDPLAPCCCPRGPPGVRRLCAPGSPVLLTCSVAAWYGRLHLLSGSTQPPLSPPPLARPVWPLPCPFQFCCS